LRTISYWTFLFKRFSYQSNIQYYSPPLIIGENLKFTGFFLNDTAYIEGDSGGKVNIFGDDFIGHCKKNGSYEHMSNSEWLPTLRFWNLRLKGHCER